MVAKIAYAAGSTLNTCKHCGEIYYLIYVFLFCRRRTSFQRSSPLKLLDQLEPNLVWIITRVSSFKIVSGDAVHPEFAKLHMGLVVLVKKMSVLINFLLQNTNLVSVLSKICPSFAGHVWKDWHISRILCTSQVQHGRCY